MSDDVNTRLVKVEHRQDTIERVVHEAVTTQKETNESMNRLTNELSRLIDRYDGISENQKDQGKQLKENTSRLDKMESNQKLFNSIITAIVVGSILVAMNLK